MIVTATYPDNFTTETETLISNAVAMASDPEVKAIVWCQAVPGTAAAIDKVRETRPDMIFIAGTPGEDPGVINPKADIVLQVDEPGCGTVIPPQAKAQGAKTLIHYSFPRHMSYALIVARHENMKKYCEENGIEMVDVTRPVTLVLPVLSSSSWRMFRVRSRSTARTLYSSPPTVVCRSR